VNPDVAADAVTGHWDGTKMNTVYAVSAILGLQVPKRQTPSRPAAKAASCVEEDVSAETPHVAAIA
jgi:hypothetical protein